MRNDTILSTRYYTDNYEEEIEKDSNIRKIHYLWNAIYIDNSKKEDEFYYIYTDYQGSLLALINENDSVVERYAYDAWGRRRNLTDWTQWDMRTQFKINRGYTAHEHIDDFGIINMNGRIYDPVTAQFFSPDPFMQFADDWLNYNRYAYCRWNPLIRTDWTGFYEDDDPTIELNEVITYGYDLSELDYGYDSWYDMYGFEYEYDGYFNLDLEGFNIYQVKYNDAIGYIIGTGKPTGVVIDKVNGGILKFLGFNGSQTYLSLWLGNGFQFSEKNFDRGYEGFDNYVEQHADDYGDNLLNGIGGFGIGMNEIGGSFRLTNGAYNGSRFSPKIYAPKTNTPNGWRGGGRARITTYGMIKWGTRLSRGTAIAGGVIGVGRVGYYFFTDGGYGYNAQKMTASILGGLGGSALGGWGGAVAGASIGAWFGGVGAIPGAFIGGIIGSIGGGWGGTAVGEYIYDNYIY